MSVADDIIELVSVHPDLTEKEIAEHLFPNPYQQRVNSTCRKLVQDGRLKRNGLGGNADPYRYTK